MREKTLLALFITCFTYSSLIGFASTVAYTAGSGLAYALHSK